MKTEHGGKRWTALNLRFAVLGSSLAAASQLETFSSFRDAELCGRKWHGKWCVCVLHDLRQERKEREGKKKATVRH
jgi:hypothetical protein